MVEKIYQQLIKGLRTYLKKTPFKKVVLGLSGGVDSSVVLKLAIDALGTENVAALLMPELGVTTQENIEHAQKLCNFLEVDYYVQPLNSLLIPFKNLPWKPNTLAQMNLRARIRMLLLYNYANTHWVLVLGTSNKSELLLGYATKYGDLACDLEVIGDLFKTEVFELARFLELPEEIIKKTPSAELKIGQTDEGELGASYKELDQVLKLAHLKESDIIGKGIRAPLVHFVSRRMRENRHKLKVPPVIKIKR